MSFNKCQIPMMIEMLQNKLKYLSFSFLYRTGSVNPCVRFWHVNTRQPSCNSVYLTNSYACRIPLVTWHLNCENSICISKLMIVIDKVHSMYWWHYWPWCVSYVTPYAEMKVVSTKRIHHSDPVMNLNGMARVHVILRNLWHVSYMYKTN